MARGSDQGRLTVEFIEPTPRFRRNFAVLFAATLIVGVTAIEFVDTEVARLKTQPICESITPFWFLSAVVFGGLVACGIAQAWMGHRALKLNQWPLASTVVSPVESRCAAQPSMQS